VSRVMWPNTDKRRLLVNSIDHNILLSRLSSWFAVHGTVHVRFRRGRKFVVLVVGGRAAS